VQTEPCGELREKGKGASLSFEIAGRGDLPLGAIKQAREAFAQSDRKLGRFARDFSSLNSIDNALQSTQAHSPASFLQAER